VTHTEEFPAAFDAALRARKPALLHIKIDPEAISPTTTLSKLRERK
jgi:acetolactate synthase-1/2/3 large subunit